MAIAQSNDPFVGAKWLTVANQANPLSDAKWIWVQKPGEPAPSVEGAPAGTVRFRKEWELRTGYKGTRLKFTADNSSEVKINGKVVGKSFDWRRAQDIDISEFILPGKNVFEVTATNDPGTNILNPGGFLLHAEADFAGMKLHLNSDSSWTSPDGKVVEIGPYSTSPWNLREPGGPCPVFNGSMPLKGEVKRATAKVIGLGHYDLYVGSTRQGTNFANQPWSQYDKTIYWQEFDITNFLKRERGLNISIVTGNSFWRVDAPPPGRYTKGDAMPNFGPETTQLVKALVDIEYQNGERDRFVTDETWRWTEGPYKVSHIFAGEDYDGTLPFYNWTVPADNQGPRLVKVVEGPPAKLLPMDFPPLKEKERWQPTKILNPKPGVWTYVFPQNASAILRFKVNGPRKTKVKFRPSEVLSENGEAPQLNLHGGDASCTYTLKGVVSETHEWRFWYHGFQFVEVTGAVPSGQPNPEKLPVLESLEMVHVRADNKEIGTFQTSSDLYNRTHNLVDWAIKSNMSYVMSDCPHREKLGWLEQVHLLFPSHAYRYDTQAWFRKISRDIRDAQLPDGRITTVAPDYLMLPPENAFKFTVEWGAAGVLMPWQAYQWYGDKRFLTENYESMKRFVDWLAENSKNGIAPEGLGDWYDYGHGQGPGPSRYTPTDLTSTAMWAMCVDALAGSAEVLTNLEDARKYRALKLKIKSDFLARFHEPEKKQFKNSGSVQTAHAMALCADLVPANDRAAVLNAIIDELRDRGYQQTAGDVGHLFFIRALAEAGRSDVLHKVYSRTGVGSYGGILAKGLTTMPETWDAITVGSNSLNHCMLGHVMEWFYGWVLGIRQAPGSVGWKHILIAPEPGSLTQAKGGTSTVLGRVSVDWKRTGHDFRLTVEVPKGAKATVTLPMEAPFLTVDGKKTAAKKGEFGRASVEVGPGKHVVCFDA